MNKNRSKAIFLGLAVALFAFSAFLVPHAKAAPAPPGGSSPSGYVEIPLAPYTRPAVGLKPASGCSPTGLITDCRDVTVEPGIYNFVGKTVRIESATITGVAVMSQSSINNGYVSTNNFAFVRGGTGESIRVYGLTLNNSYKISFTFDDKKSSDIVTLVSQVAKFCPALTSNSSSSTAHNIAYNLVNGCGRYKSEPFLPAVIAGTEANDGGFFPYNKAVVVLAATTIKTPVATTTTPPVDSTNPDTCQIPATDSGRWLTCLLLGWGENATNLLDSLIQNFLFAPTEQIFSPQLKTAWNSFRIIGVVLILIAGLTMVISQALGLELFDAYTVKKILPRLLIAAIGISLSWPIMQFVVTFFNDLGVWSHDIILFPFRGLQNNGGGAIIAGGIGITASIPLILKWMGPSIFPLLGTIILGLLIALVVLSLRQIIILLAVLIAPLAIAAYILPGTQKLWEFWKNTFLTSLFMFPIIMAFIASGKAMALVAANVPDNPQMHVLSVFVYFAPYFLLPFAFKLAGGLMSTIFSIANDKNRGAFDRLRKSRQGMGAQHRERTIGRQVLQKRADYADRLRTSASRSGRSRFGRGITELAARSFEGYNIEGAMSNKRAAVTKEVRDIIESGADGQVRGLTVNKKTSARRVNDGVVEYQSAGGAWVKEADVDRAYSRWGGDTFAQKTALSYEMSKANSEEEVASIAKNYRSLAQGPGGWKQTDYEAGGTWIGAAFENQNQHLEYKKMDWKTGELGVAGSRSFVDELYEKRGSYPLAQMHSRTIQQLSEGYVAADNVIRTSADANEIAAAQDHKEKITAIAETFMHQLGGQIGESDGQPIPDLAAQPQQTGGRQPFRQASTPGAAHVGERVAELARLTGVKYAEPSGLYSDNQHTGGQHRREQS